MPHLRILIFLFVVSFLSFSCSTTPYLQGITPEGEKVYIGPTPLQGTEPYQMFLSTSRSEIDKLNYLFKRFLSAKDYGFYRDNIRYSWIEAFRGGHGLLRERYQEGMDARAFIHEHVSYSESSGRPYAIEFPDGSRHLGSFVLINELDLLDATIAEDSNA